MRIRTVAAGVAALTAVGAVAAAAPVSASSESITLTFQSLAFQDTTIAATDEIVAAWNEANPDIEVEIIQGSWDNVHDQLVTQFAGGTAPDIIHDESADIMGFANQGYLYDLSGDLSEETLSAVSDDVWSTVTTADGAVVAAPTLLQSYVVFANPAAFEAAGVELPTGDTLAWDDFQAAAEALTTDDAYGVGWGLRSPTATIMSLSLGFGGEFFTTDGDETTIEVGDAEMEVPNRIQQMAYETLSLDPVTLTQSGSEVLPGFLGGTYAMYVGGNYVAQQLTEGAPEDFEWVVLPPLAGSEGAMQAANPQTLSVSADSEHPAEAAQFIDFYMQAANLAAVAEGDWLIPASAPARDALVESTGGENGWAEILVSGESLVAAPFQSVAAYPQWKDQIATPAYQQYFANQLGAEDLQAQLTDGWEQVAGR